MLIEIIEILGTVAFAISGAIKGLKYNLDIFGVAVLGIVTAIGGGIIRDIILNDSIPLSFASDKAIYYPLGASLLTYLFACKIENYTYFVKIFDAAGLAVFTIMGVNIGLESDLGVMALMIIGTLSGVAGGVIRDILVGEVPFILKEDVYAVLCMAGSLVYVLIIRSGKIELSVAAYTVMLMMFIFRLLAMKMKLHLPKKSS